MYKLKICPKHEKTLIINYITIITIQLLQYNYYNTIQYKTKQNNTIITIQLLQYNTILFICFLFKLFTIFELIESLWQEGFAVFGNGVKLGLLG